MAISRLFWLIPGYGLLGLGLAGFFIPGLPGTVFLILAVACFKKGSPRMEQWMLANPAFGPVLRDWEENRWISARVKLISISCIMVFTAGSMFSIKNPWGIVAVFLLGAWGVIYIATRRTKPSDRDAERGKADLRAASGSHRVS